MKVIAYRAAFFAAAVTLASIPLFAADSKLTGTVLDENGTPVAGAKISVTTSHQKDFSAAASADEAGRFEVTVPNAKWEYEVRVEHDGFSPSLSEAPSAKIPM